ncbi:MAG: ribosome silencing factor [Candidatus Nitrohelix vancouverensis]|uniref:Ribosomal silencing factor RsfS n=1 Tax=Candidatus Nitrohelix vancouverensis TaxID=2705534 RepID=A0A7T0C0V4_9BACT|nr:MAG: ribosome silencing factor [Candidatus Nitrohelix vancouverensis]
MTDTLTELQSIAISAAADKKAFDIILLDLRGRSDLTDAFLICSGASKVQVQAIADSILEKTRLAKYKTIAQEGFTAGNWVILDFMDIIVHVFQQDSREFYDLERLWGDVPVYKAAGQS